jgi:hypothetical protein
MQTFSQYGPVLDVRGISAGLDRFYGQVALSLSLVLDSDYFIFRYIIWCSLALRSAGSLRLFNIRSLASTVACESSRLLVRLLLYRTCLDVLRNTRRTFLGNLQPSFPFWWTWDCRLPGLIPTALIARDQCLNLDGYCCLLLASLGDRLLGIAVFGCSALPFLAALDRTEHRHEGP